MTLPLEIDTISNMNITELSRILKVTPQELRDTLPQIGFDIGQKAIKIDQRLAQKIIQAWPLKIKQLNESLKKEIQITQAKTPTAPLVAKIPRLITVKNFAETLKLPVSKILSELIKNGVFASMNEKIDFDTAMIIGEDLGFEIILDENQTQETGFNATEKIKTSLENCDEKNLIPRAPVIVVMGHVDHGKTSLLDAIRNTSVTSDEAGGITQHIGAYQVTRKNHAITFIDTPGHEAFTAMRSRGAKIADIAILVVAADDGVKPQTIESFNIIKTAQLPFIVAINKIDKDGADINRVKEELSTRLNIISEDWGGKIVCAPISAKKNQGITELLDMVLLAAEIDAKSMKADPSARAIGTIIESRVSKGEGPVATLLVQNGTLKIGDNLTSRGQDYGKVRALKNYRGELVKKADPSMPVRIIGLKAAPEVGDIIETYDAKKEKLKEVKKDVINKIDNFTRIDNSDEENIPKLNIILKSDVLGSSDAIEESLAKINTKKSKIKVTYKGLGNVTEGDVSKAEGTKSLIVAFNVKINPAAAEIARAKNITVLSYNVIYHLIQEVQTRLSTIIKTEYERVDLGRLKVLGVFRTNAYGQIVGGKVLDGKIEARSKIEVLRDKNLIAAGKLIGLQSGKQNVPEIATGQECGLQYEGKPIIQANDILIFYKEQEVKE